MVARRMWCPEAVGVGPLDARPEGSRNWNNGSYPLSAEWRNFITGLSERKGDGADGVFRIGHRSFNSVTQAVAIPLLSPIFSGGPLATPRIGGARP